MPESLENIKRAIREQYGADPDSAKDLLLVTYQVLHETHEATVTFFDQLLVLNAALNRLHDDMRKTLNQLKKKAV